MAKYVVKFGDLYSTGGPNEDGLQLTEARGCAWVTTDRELAHRHAEAWSHDAVAAGRGLPRVVRLKKKS